MGGEPMRIPSYKHRFPYIQYLFGFILAAKLLEYGKAGKTEIQNDFAGSI
jgi:hypothetical protein